VITGGFYFGVLLQFAIPAVVWAGALILFPTRNNLARLVILALTAYYVVMTVLGILGLLSAFSLSGLIYFLIPLAATLAAAAGSFLIIQEEGNEWFGSLTDVSMPSS
jgi:hypothetical protein